jgi:hypothetical protein
MNRAKVGVSAGSACCDREFLIGVERGRFLELLLDAHDGMWFVVVIDPGDLLTRLHRYSLGIKREVFDLDSVLLGAVGVLHLASEREDGQIEKSDAAQQCRHLIFGSECSHKLSGYSFVDLTKVGVDDGECGFALLVLNAR